MADHYFGFTTKRTERQFRLNGTQVTVKRKRLTRDYYCYAGDQRLKRKFKSVSEAAEAGISHVLREAALKRIWHVFRSNGIPVDTIAVLINAN